MATIQLNDEETELLHDILRSSFNELEMEIGHTDRREFRDYLKTREALLRRLIEELEEAPKAV